MSNDYNDSYNEFDDYHFVPDWLKVRDRVQEVLGEIGEKVDIEIIRDLKFIEELCDFILVQSEEKRDKYILHWSA